MTNTGSDNSKQTTANQDRPALEDYSNRAVVKKVLSEATQHPTTLVPAAVAGLGTAWLALLNPSETAFYMALGGGLLSLLSFVYHYFIRGEKVAVEFRKEMLEKRRNYKDRQSFDIEAQCRKAGFSEGEQAARELLVAYLRLKNFLKDKYQQRQSASAKRYLTLGEDCYDQGVSFLKKALALYQAIHDINEQKLQQELTDWESEVATLEQNLQEEEESAKLVIKALQKRIDSHKRRLELYAQRQETLKKVLAECEILEATLDSTYLEVVDLIEVDHQIRRENVAKNLERTVMAARRVEDRLRGVESGSQFDDSIYARSKEE